MTQHELDLLHGYLNGTIADEDFARLQTLLRENTEARRMFRTLAAIEAKWLELAAADTATLRWMAPSGTKPEPARLRSSWPVWLRRPVFAFSACAALLVALAGAWAWLALQPVAGLEAVRGAVTVLRDGKVIPGADALALRAGDVVRTGAGAGVRVQWRSEATCVELQPEAELRLATLKGDKHLALQLGTLTVEVAKQAPGHPMVLVTSNAQAEVLGTKFMLSALPDKTTRMQVEKGRMLLGRAGGPDEESDEEKNVIVAGLQTALVPERGEIEVGPLPASETIDTGLLAHWPLDEGQGNTARDHSGNNHHLSIKELKHPVGWVENVGGLMMGPGGLGRADSPEMDLGQAFNLSFWVRLPEASYMQPENGRYPIRFLLANTRAGAANNGFRLFADRPHGETCDLMFEVGDGQRVAAARSKASSLKYDRWQHLSVNVDCAANQCAIYVDGRDVTKRAELLAGFKTRSRLNLGSLVSYSGFRDVRLYSRTLSEEEIQHLAQPSP